MIRGIFIFIPGAYLCSSRVGIDIKTSKTVTTTLITVGHTFGKTEHLHLNMDVDCVIKYEVGPPLRFTANVRTKQENCTFILKVTSDMKRDNVTQLLSTIAKLK